MSAANDKKVTHEDMLRNKIIEELNLYDWKLGIRGTKDDEYFVKLQKWINSIFDKYDMDQLILVLFAMQNLHHIIPKRCGCSYKSIYDILTNSV